MSQQSLPLEITNVSIRLPGEKTPKSTLATGLVVYNGHLNIRIRVLHSKNGPFPKMPNFRIGEGDAAKWYDYAFFTGDHGEALRNDFQERVIAMYNAKVSVLGVKPVVAEEVVIEAGAELGEDDEPFTEDE